MSLLLALVALVPPWTLPPIESCTTGDAVSIPAEQFGAEPEHYLGQCVTVRGPAWGRALYSDISGYYLSWRRGGNGRFLPEHRRHEIGLYFEEPGPGRPVETNEEFRLLTVTGIADSCARLLGELDSFNESERLRREAGATDTVYSMPAGYCHHREGAVIWVSEYALDPHARFERLVGEEARERYGTLILAPPDWRHLAGLRARASAFAEAIRRGDVEQVAKLHGRFGASSEELDYIFVRPDSPFREMRKPGFSPQIAILVEKVDRSGVAATDRHVRDASFCYCRTRDCSGLWPIAWTDTWDRADHPYVCVELWEDGGGHLFLRTGVVAGKVRAAPLAEPERTAFRRN